MGHHVDGGVDQVLGAQLHARLADSKDLRVGGWIVGLGNLVGALGEDGTVLDDHCREWATALGDVLASQVDSALGEIRHRSSWAEILGIPGEQIIRRVVPTAWRSVLWY